tara:strand:- start:119 stop:1900 length:1782 start_codon:yes stop_codon:yes gene_type:complete
MADAVRATVADLEGLVAVMKELGLVTTQNEKSNGIFEKGQRKIKKSFAKSPYVKAAKGMAGYFKAFKQIGDYTVKARSAGDEQLAAMEEEMTGLTKLTATMIFHTGIAKLMNKVGGKTNSMFGSLLLKILSLVTIFAMVAFAIGMVVLAFQGADSPLLVFTDGIWGVDSAAQGLVMAFTGEGEGGLYGAVNIVAAALAAGLVTFMLFGATMGLLVGSALLIVGTFQLLNKEFDNIYVALAGATTVALLLAAGFLYLKIQAVTAAGATASAWMVALAPILIGVALITGALLVFYLFATGKLSGWLGWAVGLIATAALAAGMVILFGLTWPIALIIAAIVFVIAIVYRYWDEIVAFFKPAIDVIIAVAKMYYTLVMAAIGIAYDVIVAVFKGIWGVVSYIIDLFIAIVKGAWNIIWGVIVFAGKAIGVMFNLVTWPFRMAYKGIIWFFGWIAGAPRRVGNKILDGIKWVLNKFLGLWNSTAGALQFDIPDWVPVIGGKTFGLPKIPLLAKGGIVNSPTLAMIGEDGPEAVVPLTQKNNPNGIGLGGGGGPITININAGGITDRTDKRALAREIGDAIRDEMYRSGRSMGTRRGAL